MMVGNILEYMEIYKDLRTFFYRPQNFLPQLYGLRKGYTWILTRTITAIAINSPGNFGREKRENSTNDKMESSWGWPGVIFMALFVD